MRKTQWMKVKQRVSGGRRECPRTPDLAEAAAVTREDLEKVASPEKAPVPYSMEWEMDRMRKRLLHGPVRVVRQ